MYCFRFRFRFPTTSNGVRLVIEVDLYCFISIILERTWFLTHKVSGFYIKGPSCFCYFLLLNRTRFYRSFKQLSNNGGIFWTSYLGRGGWIVDRIVVGYEVNHVKSKGRSMFQICMFNPKYVGT